jgi:hypothetical protein
VLFVIHGGPHGVYQDEWSFGRNPQVWAARGYATVMVNFHGSTGFSKGFAQAVLEHRGDRVLEDLQKGWAAVLAAYPSLDGDRACAMGGSFGGYMVDWIAGVWNEPWRCFITHAGTFDTRAYSSDLQWHGDRQTGGAPWEVPEAVERFNPVRYAAQWKSRSLSPMAAAISACRSTRGFPPSRWRSGAAFPVNSCTCPARTISSAARPLRCCGTTRSTRGSTAGPRNEPGTAAGLPSPVQRILGALVAGVLLGQLAGEHVSAVAWIGELWIRFIRMMVLPLVLARW